MLMMFIVSQWVDGRLMVQTGPNDVSPDFIRADDFEEARKIAKARYVNHDVLELKFVGYSK